MKLMKKKVLYAEITNNLYSNVLKYLYRASLAKRIVYQCIFVLNVFLKCKLMSLNFIDIAHKYTSVYVCRRTYFKTCNYNFVQKVVKTKTKLK